MLYPPVADLSLETREEVAAALKAMLSPLEARLSPGAARLVLSVVGANSEPTAQELEALSRLCWGLAPLLAGGDDHPIARRLPDMLGHGADPGHPEYWGDVTEPGIRAVEMAPLGVGLALCPDAFWHGLPTESRNHLYRWLDQINRIHLWPNNWLFFRVLVNLGFRAVGRPTADDRVAEDLEMLDSWCLGDGWYRDGNTSRCDYYVAFAFHFYGLIYAALHGEADPERARRFRDRAAAFAGEYIHWFAPDGASFPFGRSLIYRFAVASFWGALAFADVEALPWGVIKGLYLRNLRWWFRRPIFSETGLLTLGFAYPNLNLPETYSSPGSPYWAFKAFLPLALPAGHPFWRAEEQPLPDLEPIRTQPHARMVISRDAEAGHVVALAGGQLDADAESHLRYGDAKYARFAYSSHFGFSLPLDRLGLFYGAYDSMLALSDDGVHYRPRRHTEEAHAEDGVHYSRWRPWPDVEVETRLIPVGPWHVRVHRVNTERSLHTAEGGFALKKDDETLRPADTRRHEADGEACVANPFGFTGLRDLRGGRAGVLLDPAANTNLIEPLTVLPMLKQQLDPGRHLLACAVFARPGVTDPGPAWSNPPQLEADDATLTVRDPAGDTVYHGPLA